MLGSPTETDWASTAGYLPTATFVGALVWVRNEYRRMTSDTDRDAPASRLWIDPAITGLLWLIAVSPELVLWNCLCQELNFPLRMKTSFHPQPHGQDAYTLCAYISRCISNFVDPDGIPLRALHAELSQRLDARSPQRNNWKRGVSKATHNNVVGGYATDAGTVEQDNTVISTGKQTGTRRSPRRSNAFKNKK